MSTVWILSIVLLMQGEVAIRGIGTPETLEQCEARKKELIEAAFKDGFDVAAECRMVEVQKKPVVPLKKERDA